MNWTPAHRRHCAVARQRGFTLMLMLFVIVVVMGAVLFTYLKPSAQTINNDKVTAAALARAKEALIGYAASHSTLPGSLPCPDTDNDGSANASPPNCTAYIGRLPWKQLGLSDLRDGGGECLWYALSPVFRNALSAGNRSPVSNPLNSNIAGQLTVYDASGTALPTPPNQIIAIIFAPGSALSGQNRTPAGSTVCGGNNNAAAYLDTAAGINNATGNGTNSFIAGNPANTFNDRLLYISAAQFFPAVQKRVAAEIRGFASPSSGLIGFYVNRQNYPWAADASGNQVASNTSGVVPFNDPDFLFSDTAQSTWLLNNSWFNLVSYSVAVNFQPSTLFPQKCGPAGAGCLTVNGYNQSQAAVTVGAVSSIVCTTNPLVTTCAYP